MVSWNHYNACTSQESVGRGGTEAWMTVQNYWHRVLAKVEAPVYGKKSTISSPWSWYEFCDSVFLMNFMNCSDWVFQWTSEPRWCLKTNDFRSWKLSLIFYLKHSPWSDGSPYGACATCWVITYIPVTQEVTEVALHRTTLKQASWSLTGWKAVGLWEGGGGGAHSTSSMLVQTPCPFRQPQASKHGPMYLAAFSRGSDAICFMAEIPIES